MSKFSETLGKQVVASNYGVGNKIKQLLDKDSYNDLLVALGDRSIPLPTVLKVLKELEVPISRAALARWRNGEPPKGADEPIFNREESK